MFGWEREEAWQRFADEQGLQLALADLRRAVDDFKLYVAHKRIAALELELKYRPDQPRAPAGYREGGQWTRDGSGTPRAARRRERVDDLGGEIANALGLGVADPAERAPHSASYRVDVREQDARGGHTIEEHVAKSDEYLLRRMRQEQIRLSVGTVVMVKVTFRVGSYTSVSAANALTSSTLAQHSETVDLVASGRIKRKAVESWFRAPTGKEAFANQLHQSGGIRPTFGVRAIIQHDPKAAEGFRVVTSFPINP